MKKRIGLISLLVTAAMLFSLAGCSNTTGKLEKIKKKGTMVVYTNANFPPFEYFGVGDEIVGVDIDIAKAIADELGVKLEVKDGDFDSLLMSLKGGRGDVAISGFTITEDRKKNVSFSDPYINSVQYLILKKDDADMTVEGLAGKKVAVAEGYTGSLIIDDEIKKGVLKDKGTTFDEYGSAADAALALKSDKAAVVIMDEYVAKNIVSKDDSLKAVELRYDDGTPCAEEYGVAVPHGNDELLEVINTVIARLKNENLISQWVVSHSE